MRTRNVEIVSAERQDMPALRRIYRSASLSNAADRARLLADPEFLELSDRSVRERRTRVAVANGQVLGFASATEAEAGLEVEDLFLDPDHMRRGVGRALIRDMVRAARLRGDRRVFVVAPTTVPGHKRLADPG